MDGTSHDQLWHSIARQKLYRKCNWNNYYKSEMSLIAIHDSAKLIQIG